MRNLEVEVFEPQIAEHAAEHKDVEACEELWRAVLHQAVSDLRYLRRFEEGATELKKHELEKVRRIGEYPPQEFLDGAWFEAVCQYLEVDPTEYRSWVREQLKQAA